MGMIPEHAFPALCLRPELAEMILRGVTTKLMRRFQTRVRGDLLIAATLKGCGIGLPKVVGRAVCLAELVDVRPTTPADCIGFEPPSFVWELANVRPAQPRKIRGMYRLFFVKAASVVVTGRDPLVSGEEKQR